MGMASPEIVSKTSVNMGDGRRVDFVGANLVTLYKLDGDDDTYYEKVSDDFGMKIPICVLAVCHGDDRACFFRPIARRTGGQQIIDQRTGIAD